MFVHGGIIQYEERVQLLTTLSMHIDGATDVELLALVQFKKITDFLFLLFNYLEIGDPWEPQITYHFKETTDDVAEIRT